MLPLTLASGIGVVMALTRALQWMQFRVLHKLPFGSLSQFNLKDVCLGILTSGLVMMYFGAQCLSHPLAPCLKSFCDLAWRRLTI